VSYIYVLDMWVSEEPTMVGRTSTLSVIALHHPFCLPPLQYSTPRRRTLPIIRRSRNGPEVSSMILTYGLPDDPYTTLAFYQPFSLWRHHQRIHQLPKHCTPVWRTTGTRSPSDSPREFGVNPGNTPENRLQLPEPHDELFLCPTPLNPYFLPPIPP